MADNYPEITYPEVYKVQTIGIKLRSDSEYIEKSPYTTPIKDALTAIFFRDSKKINKDSEKSSEPISIEDINIEEETLKLYSQTKELLESDTPLETSERIRIIQTQTNLLEKQLYQYERAKNISYVKNLENAVIKVCKTLDKEKRDEILQILKK